MKWRSSHAKWRITFRWHRWFAWHPVSVGYRDRYRVWLQVVERRRDYAGDDFVWRYREA
jgi:hypothetical protein